MNIKNLKVLKYLEKIKAYKNDPCLLGHDKKYKKYIFLDKNLKKGKKQYIINTTI